MPGRRELANAIRALAMDAVQHANAGHPGAPMGMADIAEVLWRDFLKHSPGNPRWPDRDRFVLSNGHASMLQYAVLYLTGYPLGIDEIRNFRQLGARTAGHPEHDLDVGIETTTGPLGQGFANAVGMAIAERALAATFNRPGFNVVDHHTYVFVGDGCLMEGISHEAASLAGTQQLGKLICIYDDNGISIDGHVQGWFTDNTPERFSAYGWHVLPGVDGHDAEAVKRAIAAARAESRRPSIICCKTIIGWGAPNKQGTEATHGQALGADEVAAARKTLNWTCAPFEIPEAIRSAWDARATGARREAEWRRQFDAYRGKFPELAAEFERRMQGELPAEFVRRARELPADVAKDAKPAATRVSSQATLNALTPTLPEFVGGSADLTGSNNTLSKSSKALNAGNPGGNYIYYGVREFGMTAVMNGLALHGGFIPYGGTFLTFSDYARNGVRMAALMHQRNILVYSHDSIGLGEDGPTHQPVEQLWSLRLIPNLILWRPCDAVETATSWIAAVERTTGPTALALTRQNLPQEPRTPEQIADIRRGGYVLVEPAGTPECIVIATGSEVGIATEAARALNGKGRRIRVVSMPSTQVFEAQDAAYRERVLPAGIRRRLVVEAGVTLPWRAYAGPEGRVIGIDHYGASGRGPDLFRKFGITAEHVTREILELVA
ncbi:MAG TPA: transketolase [Steroidobacteraceae bacterium]|nr:transketolase [Steroidobacteraceae bacterium]